jgi:hypothetical protein
MRRAIFTLALVDLVAVVLVRLLYAKAGDLVFALSIKLLGVIITPIVLVDLLTLVVGVLALVVAAQQHSWGWFGGLLLVTALFDGSLVIPFNLAQASTLGWAQVGLRLAVSLAALAYGRLARQNGTQAIKVTLLVFSICSLMAPVNAILMVVVGGRSLATFDEPVATFLLGYLLAMTADVLVIVETARQHRRGWLTGFAVLTVLGLLSPLVLFGAAFAGAYNDTFDPTIAVVASATAVGALAFPYILSVLALLYLFRQRHWKSQRLGSPAAAG